MRLITLVLLLSVLSTIGCEENRYEIRNDDYGRTIRVDKKTGEVAILSELEQLSEVQFWPKRKIELLGIETAELNTFWRNEKLFFNLIILPSLESLTGRNIEIILCRTERENNLLNQLPEAEGKGRVAEFEVKRITINNHQIVKLVGENQGEYVGHKVTGSVPCSPEEYLTINHWSLIWTQ